MHRRLVQRSQTLKVSNQVVHLRMVREHLRMRLKISAFVVEHKALSVLTSNVCCLIVPDLAKVFRNLLHGGPVSLRSACVGHFQQIDTALTVVNGVKTPIAFKVSLRVFLCLHSRRMLLTLYQAGILLDVLYLLFL